MSKKEKSETSSRMEDWLRAAEGMALGEDRALALCKHADLPGNVLEALAKNESLRDSRRVQLRIAVHPHTPGRVARRLLRQLHTFDLMQATLTPGVRRDVVRAAEDLLIRKLESVTLGERISLARRGSGRVAASLLVGQPRRVQEIALENPRLTEPLLLVTLRRPTSLGALLGLAALIASNHRWMRNQEVKTALNELLREDATDINEIEEGDNE